MKITNRTPHPIVVGNRTFDPTGNPLRIEMPDPTDVVKGSPIPAVRRTDFDHGAVRAVAREIVDDISDIVLVPRMLLDALAQHHRKGDPNGLILRALWKCAAPDTSPKSVIRDENGRIVGVSRVVVSELLQDFDFYT